MPKPRAARTTVALATWWVTGPIRGSAWSADPVAGLLGLGERHAVRITGTAALMDRQPEPGRGRVLLREQLTQLATRDLGETHHAWTPSVWRGRSPAACLDVSACRAMSARPSSPCVRNRASRSITRAGSNRFGTTCIKIVRNCHPAEREAEFWKDVGPE